jgi:hypothetical protein
MSKGSISKKEILTPKKGIRKKEKEEEGFHCILNVLFGQNCDTLCINPLIIFKLWVKVKGKVIPVL